MINLLHIPQVRQVQPTSKPTPPHQPKLLQTAWVHGSDTTCCFTPAMGCYPSDFCKVAASPVGTGVNQLAY